jgi:cobalt-zinc-cadmium efflux system outer membrane protein
VAPQYYLMGYIPYTLTVAQKFPWFGTLRLRGEAAVRDVQIALAELAAAQLDTVASVKRANDNLYASMKIAEILVQNRDILEDFRAIARQRLAAGGTQQDVLRSEILISEVDREVANNQQGIAAARAGLARQLHVRPDAELKPLPELVLASVSDEVERLNQLAVAARPELQGRLAAIARDQKAVELAQKAVLPQRHARANLHGHG